MVSLPVDVDLALFAYQVDASPASSQVAPLERREVSGSTSATDGQVKATGGARAEIITAIQAVGARSGRKDATVQEVVDQLRRVGSSYAESTIRTMMTSHMCAQTHGPNIGSYDDLDRVDRGTYRLRDERGAASTPLGDSPLAGGL